MQHATPPQGIQFAAQPHKRTIDLKQLLPGDLIFQWGAHPTPAGNQGMWTHVGICSSVDATSGLAAWVHAVYTKPIPIHGAWETKLNPPDLTRPDTDPHQYQVLRCRREALRERAAELAARWSRDLIPYGFDRLDKVSEFEAQADGDKVEKHRELFMRAGKFRAIKYAARREGYLCFPDEIAEDRNRARENFGKGVTCAQFVAICYQVAGIEDYVDAPQPDPRVRVTDKKMRPKDLDQFQTSYGDPKWGPEYRARLLDWEQYKSYQRGLDLGASPHAKPAVGKKTTTAFPGVTGAIGKSLPHVAIIPSFDLWNYKDGQSIASFPWKDAITEGMMVDCKLIFPNTLYASLERDRPGWENMGNLVGKYLKDDTLKNRQEQTITEANARRVTFLNKP